VPQKYCEEGIRLDSIYFDKTRAWVGAEADKRIAVGSNRGVGVNEWDQIVQRAEDTKAGHEQALRLYMEHMIACPVCNSHVLAPSTRSLANHHG
jgi:hypothetical protein